MSKLNISETGLRVRRRRTRTASGPGEALRQAARRRDDRLSIYEIPPGQAICPYHYEYAEEEWLVVLEGAPTLRTSTARPCSRPWDVCVFPAGPGGAHGVRNETDEVVRVMMFSDVRWPAATVYPDSDKIGVWTGNDEDSAMFRRALKVEYFTDEPGV